MPAIETRYRHSWSHFVAERNVWRHGSTLKERVFACVMMVFEALKICVWGALGSVKVGLESAVHFLRGKHHWFATSDVYFVHIRDEVSEELRYRCISITSLAWGGGGNLYAVQSPVSGYHNYFPEDRLIKIPHRVVDAAALEEWLQFWKDRLRRLHQQLECLKKIFCTMDLALPLLAHLSDINGGFFLRHLGYEFDPDGELVPSEKKDPVDLQKFCQSVIGLATHLKRLIEIVGHLGIAPDNGFDCSDVPTGLFDKKIPDTLPLRGLEKRVVMPLQMDLEALLHLFAKEYIVRE